MKRVVVFFTTFFLAVSIPTVPTVPAQMFVSVPVVVSAPVPVPAPIAVVPPTLDRIGVVAAAGGKVELTTPGQVGRVAQSGQAIFMGDEVKTDLQGRLQILLLDETVFTIGPNSTIIIDRFVYDPKSHKGEIKASITKGVFRYVSGKIAAKNPDSVKVKLPTATLGFRGTIVGGSVGANGQGLAALLGPGANNDAGAQNGSFSIEGTGGDHQDVNRTGFGVEFDGNGGLSGVFQLSDDQINGLTGGLGGGNPGGGGGSGGNDGSGLGGGTDMGDLSGENNALTGDNVSFTGGLDNLTDNLDDVSIKGAQDALDASGAASNSGSATTLGAMTTYEEMQQIINVTDTYHFEEQNVATDNPNISYKIFADINFTEGSQSVGGGYSRVEVDNNGTSLSFDLSTAQSFSSGANPFKFADVPEVNGNPYTINLDLTVMNTEGGQVGSIDATAVAASHAVKLYDTVSVTPLLIAEGTGEAPRQSDPSPSSGPY